MKTFISLIVALFAFSICTLGQQPEASVEYGKPSDLKGLTKVYVETMGDLKENERITERLQKAKIPNLQIVDDRDDAEIILMFGGDNFSSLVGATHNGRGNTVTSTLNRVNLLEGQGLVLVAGRDNSKIRVVMRVQNEQETKWEKRPVTKFVNDFVKVYKTVNGLK